MRRARIDSAADVVTRELFEAIIYGRLAPGSPLRLKDLAELLGTSMMPVREALNRLAATGLVELEPRKGARVRDLTLVDLEDTYFTRLHLESIAVWEAARRFTPEDEARARAALADQDAAQAVGDRVRARDAYERFHFALYEASGRPSLVHGIVPGWRNAERYREAGTNRVDLADQRNGEHTRILTALTVGDAEQATRWLMEHLRTSIRLSRESLFAQVAEVDPEPEDLPEVESLLERLRLSSAAVG